jgi:hypothetical protein
MRRYDIVSGILLILSIIRFALAAPVLVQEKRQACGDVAHIPRDVITVLGKRVDLELQRLIEGYFERVKTGENPVESTYTHASSNPALVGPDHASASLVHAPAPNPAPSTSDPNPLLEPLNPSSTASSAESDSDWEEYKWPEVIGHDGADTLHTYPEGVSSIGLQDGLTGAHVLSQNPNKSPLTNPDPLAEEDPPPKRPALSKLEEFGQTNEYQVEHAHQLDLGLGPSKGLPTEPGALEVVHPPWRPPSGLPVPGPIEPAAAHEVVTPPSPSPSLHEWLSKEPDNEVTQGPPGSPEITEAEAARHAASGKETVLRRISRTTRDAGNAVGRE